MALNVEVHTIDRNGVYNETLFRVKAEENIVRDLFVRYTRPPLVA